MSGEKGKEKKGTRNKNNKMRRNTNTHEYIMRKCLNHEKYAIFMLHTHNNNANDNG